MKRFAALFTQIDETTKTSRKVTSLTDYFQSAPDTDKLWTVALFTGRRPKRAITATKLREWAAEAAEIPLWLFEESYGVVGDLAETISLILPDAKKHEDRTLTNWIKELKHLSTLDEDQRKTGILQAWSVLPSKERFLFTKLLTGGFRIGVSAKLITRALAQATGQDEAALTHRLMGKWTPETTTWHDLIEADDPAADLSRPYPFYLAYGLEDIDALGDPTHWHAERKWDGIRGQFILRNGEHHVWSRGEELMTDRFPELAQLKDYLPDGTVVDGEILGYADETPLSFNALQKRIGRKTVPKKLLTEAPVIVMAYDVLEIDGIDIRQSTFETRRNHLKSLLKIAPKNAPIRLSDTVPFTDWNDLVGERAKSRDLHAEGIMLKRLDSPYLVWNGNELTPFAKAYSGLTDKEFREITAWVRKNTQQKFGPVRQVTPEHVFEIAFEGIQASSRHKSGVALRFPRMLRWRKDKPLKEANTLDDLKDMLATYG